jgi:hypothetical protein
MLTRKLLLTALLITASTRPAGTQEKVIGPVRVKIQEEKSEYFENVLPVDPVRRVEYQMQAGMNLRITCENKMLHLGNIWTALNIDEVVTLQGQGAAWRIEAQNVALPKTAAGKARDGVYSVYSVGKLRITQSAEIVPGKKPGEKKRQRDAVLVRYTIENKDSVAHKVGLRKFMDVYVVDNDGAVFAAPNQPGKILDGVELKGKMVPDYLQFLQHPNLKEPGFVGHMTFNLGSAVERPSRAVLTSLGVDSSKWDVPPLPANGDSAMAVYWDPTEIKPGGKRELAFAFGGSVAASLENEGKVKIDLAGSFEPGKQFTINAFVSDPAQGQSLTLELPAGMEILQGKETQPVPAGDGEGNCMVQWQARVLKTGSFALKVHSSLGVTYARNVSITRVDEKDEK